MAIVVAGLIGVGVHHRPARVATSPSTARTAPLTAAKPPPTTAPPTTAGQPGTSSATLAANLLTPTDLGGFYAARPDAANAFLASAPCLAGLAPAPAQSGRAVTGLLGPDAGSVPDITEVVLSYPGATAAAVYRSLVAAMQACPSFAMSLGGAEVRVPLGAAHLPAVGDADSAYQGQFHLYGRTEQLGLELVLAGHNILAISYVDTVPASNALFGDLPSTVSAAIGKEA